MCLIIDTNVLLSMLDARHPVGKLFLRWLLQRDGLLVQGGTLTEEAARVREIQATLLELKRSGRLFDARSHDPPAFDAAQRHYDTRCTSNDAHVLAVAHVSGARTLATNDKALTEDFKNAELLPRPRGRVLHGEGHAHLLKHDKGCRRPPSKHADSRKRTPRPSRR